MPRMCLDMDALKRLFNHQNKSCEIDTTVSLKMHNCDDLGGGMGGVGARFKREGIYVYIYIHIHTYR